MARFELRDYTEYGHGEKLVEFFCPGCECGHAFRVAGTKGPVWTWNEDLEKATFSPSLLYTRPYGDPPVNQVCHSFVREGRIEFLGDCTHALAGKTVDVPEYD